jgi:Short C-terminal domain
MEGVICVFVVLAVAAVVLGLARDNWMARRIGEETSSRIVPPPVEDPVILLEKLYELRQSGAITEEEYEVQKTRILGEA